MPRSDDRSSRSSPRRFARTGGLVWMLAGRELRVRYRQSLLDAGWAFITPVVILAVYGFILTQSFSVTSECGPYLSSAWLGLVIWTFFATAISAACTSLVASAHLVTKLPFPLESLPIAMVVAALADLAIGMATVVVVLVLQDVPIGPVALSVVLPLGMLIVWSTAIGVLVGVLAAFARDLVHAVQLGLRIGFFATPVVYEASFLPPQFAWSAVYNPVAVAIDAARSALLCGQMPDLRLCVAHLFAATIALVLVVAYARSVEARVPDVV